jgi:ABC-type bacteriocin/lantibiotic exporter with double-glycine peptidase domain
MQRILKSNSVAGVLLDIPHLRQDVNMCVPTCASMALQFYGESHSPDDLKALASSVSRDPAFPGTYFVDLINGLATIGFIWQERCYSVTEQGFSGGLAEVLKSLESRKSVLVDMNIQPVGHTVLVMGYDSQLRQIIILDSNVPSPGIRQISYAQFKEEWHSLTTYLRCAIFTEPRS